jgi:hypothetical protein
VPDGLFSYQKSQFGYILEGLGMENVGIFYGPLVHFTAIWYVFVIWYISSCFGMLCQEKSGNPG